MGPRTVAGRVRTLLLLAACASMLGGCAVGSGEVRDLSTEKAARLIIDGRTTMAQIDAELGEPDYEIHMGHEIVRHYSWMRGRPSAKNFIPFNPISEFPITQKNLRIWFDKTEKSCMVNSIRRTSYTSSRTRHTASGRSRPPSSIISRSSKDDD